VLGRVAMSGVCFGFCFGFAGFGCVWFSSCNMLSVGSWDGE
jgi:hypothetical protein